MYGTYFGAAGADFGTAVATDTAGNAYITGYTSSLQFPVTVGAAQPAFGGGIYDAFAAKFSAAGALLYSTLLGGSGNDTGWGITVDPSGNAYLAGQTSSTNFPLLLPFQSTLAGASDAFVAKLDPAGSRLLFSTYLGGLQPEQATAIALDSALNVYVTGATASADFPVSSGAYQSSLKGTFNAFVTVLAPTGNALVYSTFLGGSGSDQANAITVDPTGNVWIAGFTSSLNFPVAQATQTTLHGSFDAFLSVLGLNGSALRFSSYLGGSNDDRAYGLAVFGPSAYLAGTTASSDFPSTAGSVSPSYAGATDGFVTRINADLPALTPVSGTGFSQSFTFTFYDEKGYQDIAGAQVVINSTLAASYSCYILFGRPNLISLADDSGSHYSSTGLGSPSIVQNSQCSVMASLTSQSASGNTLSLILTVAFKPGFAGPKTVWANYNTVAGVSFGWDQLGSFTAVAPVEPLSVAFVSPASGTAQTQAFTFIYFDPYGAQDISGAQIVFNPTLSGLNSCYLLFSLNNTISLASDDGRSFSTAILGQATVLQNSRCIVYPGNSYMSNIGQTLSVTILVTFKPILAGKINIYSTANNNAGYQTPFWQLGSWTVPAAGPPLSLISLTPVSAAGPSQALAFVFSDPNGYTDITSMQAVIHPSLTAVASCVIQVNRSSGVIALTADSGSSVSTATLGQPVALQNSQCIVNAAASTQYGASIQWTVSLFVTMKTGGSQNVYSSVVAATSTTPFSQAGAWTVTAPGSMTPLPVTPYTAAVPVGASQPFTFTFSDPIGASDISGSQIILYPSLQGSNSCYILWGHATNLISLASDSAASFTSAQLGSSGVLQNSQCSVDASRSFQVQTGNTINLTVAVAFKAVYHQFYQVYSFVDVGNTAGLYSSFLNASNRFTVQ